MYGFNSVVKYIIGGERASKTRPRSRALGRNVVFWMRTRSKKAPSPASKGSTRKAICDGPRSRPRTRSTTRKPKGASWSPAKGAGGSKGEWPTMLAESEPSSIQ